MPLPVVQRSSSDPFGGSEQVVDMLKDRWTISLALDELTYEQGADVEAYINSMRGASNTTPLHHFVRPVPRGTARGTLTLSSAAAQGAGVLQVAGVTPSNGTFLRGDMLGTGGLLVMVQASCVAVAGAVTIPIVNRLRVAVASGTSVVWNKPTAPFRLVSKTSVQYQPNITDSVQLEFREAVGS